MYIYSMSIYINKLVSDLKQTGTAKRENWKLEQSRELGMQLLIGLGLNLASVTFFFLLLFLFFHFSVPRFNRDL